MGASDIYMRFYVGDYLADTGDLSTEEHGAYMLLLMNMWRQGGWLDADPERLRRLARAQADAWPALWSGLARFFIEEDGRITQRRLLAEYERATGISEAQAKRGRSGGLARASRRLDSAKPALSQTSESESEGVKPAPARDPSEPVPPPDLWNQRGWLLRFGAAWSKHYQTMHYGGGSADAKATADLGDTLRELSAEERIEAQVRAPEMFAEFFADTSADKARHPFAWFATRFNGLRVPAAARKPKPDTDPRCAFHRAYGTLRKLPRDGPVANCPQCREVSASRGTRVSEPEPPKPPDWISKPPPAWTAEQRAEFELLRAKG